MRRCRSHIYYAYNLLIRTAFCAVALTFMHTSASGARNFSTILPSTTANFAAPVHPVNLPEQDGERILPQTIGLTTSGLPIRAYRFGNGPQRVAFIGGIHGGYEWNSVLLAYKAIDYFAQHPRAIPPKVTIHIIPAANPDGVQRITGALGRFTEEQVAAQTAAGRFNQRGVDLNRNWDCNWTQKARWGMHEINGGTTPFSEVESQVLRDFLTGSNPVAAAVFWHSAAPGVYPGGCNSRFAAADTLAQLYATASGYPMQSHFAAYEVTGDATDWLATQEIPAIVVELKSYDQIEWEQNLAGMLATLQLFKP